MMKIMKNEEKPRDKKCDRFINNFVINIYFIFFKVAVEAKNPKKQRGIIIFYFYLLLLF